MIVALYSSTPQSGKSTVAQVFRAAGYRITSFAEPVKTSLAHVLAALGTKNAGDYLWGSRKDEIIPELQVTGGFLMSTYATDFFRNQIDEDIWLKIMQRRIDPNRNYIIDDMRFPNEFEWVKSQGGICINVVRPLVAGTHSRSELSEGNLDDYDFDYTVVNDLGLAEVVIATNGILEALKYAN